MKALNAAVAVALLAVVGCAGPKSGIDMTPTARLKVDAHLGKSWNSDNTKIADISSHFTPNETVMAAVDVPGSADGTMKVQWVYGSEVLKEQSVQLDDKTTLYRFELAPATRGDRMGEYRLEVFIDNKMSDTESFTVAAN